MFVTYRLVQSKCAQNFINNCVKLNVNARKKLKFIYKKTAYQNNNASKSVIV